MDEPLAVTQMIHRLRSDDPRERDEAARLVWEYYFCDLLALARRQIGRKLQPRVDGEDLLQSAYDSICRRQRRGEYELYDRDDFWQLLVTVTLNKARNVAKWHKRARRTVDREEAGAAAGGLLDADVLPPDAAVALAEELEARLRALDDPGDPRVKQVALKKLEGFTNREIADALDCTERTIERKLEIIRQRWSAPGPGPDLAARAGGEHGDRG